MAAGTRRRTWLKRIGILVALLGGAIAISDRKYAGDAGGRAAAETSAHGTVVGVGEPLTGRSQRAEPGDRLYRFVPK